MNNVIIVKLLAYNLRPGATRTPQAATQTARSSLVDFLTGKKVGRKAPATFICDWRVLNYSETQHVHAMCPFYRVFATGSRIHLEPYNVTFGRWAKGLYEIWI